MTAAEKKISPGQSARRYPLRCLLAGLRFLTILPTFSSAENDTLYLAGSLYYFTVIGVFLGTLGALFAALLSTIAPPLVSAALLAVLLCLFSGFLHLDGLADSADGFLSGKPAAACLAIMRDSRIGVMGAAAICATILIKMAALASIDTGRELLSALVLAPAAGRTAIICLMTLCPYARENDGLATLFYQSSTRLAAALSIAVFFALSVFLVPERTMLLVVTLSLVIVGFSYLCKKRIGGTTGDTLGAVCELTETGVLVTFSLLHF